MYVRIARFEGGDGASFDQMLDSMRSDLQGPPPPGLEGVKRLLVLVDREHGRGLGMTFFDSEAELRRADEVLNAMTPGGGGRRTSVETYEVGLQHDV